MRRYLIEEKIDAGGDDNLVIIIFYMALRTRSHFVKVLRHDAGSNQLTVDESESTWCMHLRITSS